jgi:sugar phosphate isomerase/epimerase
MRLALGLYSVYPDLQHDLPSTLQRVRQLGFAGVEFYGDPFHPPEALRQILADLDLVNCGWHVEWKLLQPDTLPATLAYQHAAGTPTLIIPALGGPWEIGHTRAEDSPAAWLTHAHQLNQLSEQLETAGFRLGYHTHAHEFSTHYAGVTPWDIIRQSTRPAILLEVDTGNCLEAGADPALAIASIPARAALVHCKPYSRTGGHETWIGHPSDASNWQTILQACRAASTQWLIVEHESQSLCPGFAGAQACLAGLKQYSTPHLSPQEHPHP